MTKPVLPTLDTRPVGQVRVRRALLALSTRSGDELTVSQLDIARLADCKRETVNRELGRLRAAGVVATGLRSVTILDREAIAASVQA